MLKLERAIGQEIVIILPCGREVVVSLEQVRSKVRVALGIVAPRDIIVHRREVINKIRAKGA